MSSSIRSGSSSFSMATLSLQNTIFVKTNFKLILDDLLGLLTNSSDSHIIFGCATFNELSLKCFLCLTVLKIYEKICVFLLTGSSFCRSQCIFVLKIFSLWVTVFCLWGLVNISLLSLLIEEKEKLIYEKKGCSKS
ncbi:hypothetical protein BpHYR1_050761 [Brachionus plicatilis]|uniref:Uncharacterized protein n=1 Tax=Brachionus plicatilis TaxID=10195 RepID=A0A3M7P9I5_BRAPC|nr:hypothetical protein BpHYR1_050761 [Brachionus plicatilis]